MAQEDVKVNIKVSGDSKDVDKSLKKTQKEFNKTKTAGKNLFNVTNMLGATAAIGAVIASVKGLVNIYKVQEQAEIRTKQTLQATGYAAGLTSKEIFKMASSLQAVTTFGDEAIIGGQNLLLTFRNIGGKTFPRATEAMLDMSTAMGVGLKESAIQLGKALNDPIQGISALTRVGITFTQSQKDQIKALQKMGDTAGAQAIILSELENQFGGVARAATEGTGSLEQTANLVGDVFEDMGKAALPIVKAINEQLKLVATYWREAFLSEDEINAKKELKSLNIELTETDKIIDKLAKSSRFTKGENIFTHVAKAYEQTELVEAFERRAELTEKIRGLQKQEEVESVDFMKRKAAAAKIIEEDANAEKLNRYKELNETLAGERLANEEVLLEEQTIKDEMDIESSAQEILRLQEKLKKENKLKLLAQAKELSDKGKHKKALDLLQKAADKERIASLKQKEKLDQQYATNSVNIAMATANLLTAVAKDGSKTAFLISKSAAIAQSIISTNVAAALALATPPGPPATAALALQVKVAGAINTAAIAATAIKGFAQGGLVTGGRPGIDSVPAMLMPGELVVPQQNFSEVISAVQSQREGGGGTDVNITVGFTDNAFDIIEENILERRSLKTGQL